MPKSETALTQTSYPASRRKTISLDRKSMSVEVSAVKVGLISPHTGFGLLASAMLADLFGPHINLTAALAAIFGLLAFYMSPAAKQYKDKTSHPFLVGSVFLTWFGSLWIVEGATTVAIDMFAIPIVQHVIPMIAFILAFCLQAILSKAVDLIKNFSFTWRGIKVGTKPNEPDQPYAELPYGSQPRTSSPTKPEDQQ